jgi:hypothetical protein
MSETQSIKESKTDGSVNGTAVEPTAIAGTSTFASTTASVVETLRELGTAWAETALGYGRVALVNAAHALERTAEKLGSLQSKLKKGDVAVVSATAVAAAN